MATIIEIIGANFTTSKAPLTSINRVRTRTCMSSLIDRDAHFLSTINLSYLVLRCFVELVGNLQSGASVGGE